MGPQWRQLAHIAADHGELTLARRAMDLFVEASGADPAARYQLAGLLAQGGAMREAHALLCALPEDVPDPAVNAYSRGAAALSLGRREEARALLERAARLRPDLGQAWLPLTTLIDFADEPEMAELMLAAGPLIERAAPGVRAIYCYALGKAHADMGEHALAFAAVARGARLKRAESKYARAQDRVAAAEAVRGYDRERIAALASQQKEPTDRSIFVTGLPRSGTTLIEQILTSHSAVCDGGEINRLRLLAHETGGSSHAALSRHVAAHGTVSAARLWSHWLDERFPAPGRIVDKSMDSGRFLGLAAALLPDAPIIWLQRDPLDCAWSCFRTHFLAGVPWSYDLEDIAFHFRLEDNLLARWQEVLGDRLLLVPYESLVAEPTAWTKRILVHCGLAEEPPAFAPHENTRAVMTSSVTQVREPINSKGVGSAEPYRQFLEPFIKAYGP
jgi:tetratricopeptide (TPR) repeat protein